MTKTLITGATGFIGCRLAESWQESGRALRASGIVRSDLEAERQAALQELGVEFREDDLDDRTVWEEALEGVDTVVHLAAAQHEANVADDYFHRINVEGTRNLLQQCEAHGVERFFYASSIGVYGVPERGGIDESTPPAPDNAYGRSKLAAEEMLRGYNGSVSVFIGRIGETYGPWDRRLHKLFAGIDSGRFWLVGPSRNLHQPVYVDDLALLIDRMLATPAVRKKPLLLCGSDAVTTRQMCEQIAAALGKKLPRVSIPISPLLLAALGMEMTLGKVGIQPPLHRRRLDFFRKSLSFSTEVRDDLLSPGPLTGFRDGAMKTASWYRQRGWL